MKMRLGCFGYVNDLDIIARAGFDCVEMHNSEIMGFNNSEFKIALKKLKDCGIPCEVFDNPIPLDKQIIDDSFNVKYYREYLRKGADRAAEMGGRFWIFGNGKSRSLPETGNIEKGKEKIYLFIRDMCDIAAQNNITILVEPLHSVISNIALNIPDTLELINEINKPNLKTLIDFRWFVASGRPYSDIERYSDYILHAHIDNPTTNFPKERIRYVPKISDGYNYGPFLSRLKNICYKGILSIEAMTYDDFEVDIKEGLELFRKHGIVPYRS
nr:sugar phosphate isomerase/epimerase family protein [Sedimentibacter sp.]